MNIHIYGTFEKESQWRGASGRSGHIYVIYIYICIYVYIPRTYIDAEFDVESDGMVYLASKGHLHQDICEKHAFLNVSLPSTARVSPLASGGGGRLAKGQRRLLMRRRWRGLARAAGAPAAPRESGARRRRCRVAFCPVNAGAAQAAVQVNQVGAPCPGQGRRPSAPRAPACQRMNGLPAAGGSPSKMPTMRKLRPGSSDGLASGARNRFI